MKKALLALAVAGAAVSAQADVSLSGHVNYAMGTTEDFSGNDDFSVSNNGLSGSRFRIVASTEANGITYGARQELGLDSGSGAPFGRVSQLTVGGDFGQFSLGQGWEVGDDIAELDFSGTYIAGSGAGAYVFGGNGVLDPQGVDGGASNVDGGRDQRLRYDSPKIGGALNVGVDYDTSDNLGLSLLAGGDNWAAGIYHENNDAANTDETAGSIAIKVAGFTAALQIGQAEISAGATDESVEDSAAGSNPGAGGEAEYKGVILGYNVGKMSIAIDFANREVSNAAGTDVVDNNTTGLSFVYRPTGGVELYAGLRTAESDLGQTIYNGSDDGEGFILGGRVKF